MMRFAEQNAAGRSTTGTGTRYVRLRDGSSLCSAASEIGANAYMIAVAPVITPTRLFQLLNGPNAMQPTTEAVMIETTGTPRALVFASAAGISRSSPSAYERRALAPR